MTPPMTAKTFLDEGSLWKDQTAKLIFPMLIWAAKNGYPITYKQVAEELFLRHKFPIKRRFTLYGMPAGKIGFVLEMLSDEWGEEIPPLNVVMVNESKGLPGKGADYFIKNFLSRQAQRKKISPKTRDEVTREVIDLVRDYPKWREVAKALGLGVIRPVSTVALDQPIKMPKPRKNWGGYPESEQHRTLKIWASLNPKFFSKFGKFRNGKTEELLRSGDSLDAYLHNDEVSLAVEVKASNAPDSEIFRGVFQCVKYRATLRAMQRADGVPPTAQAVLVTTKPMPHNATRLAKRLRVTVLRAPKGAEKPV